MSRSTTAKYRRFVPVAVAALLAVTHGWAGGKSAEDAGIRTLTEPAEVRGVPCGTGARVTEAGTLVSCRLSRDAALGEAQLPAGTFLSLNPDGTIRFAFLPANTVVQGHLCRGKGHDYMTTFHPSGTLKLCWLAKNEVIDGIPCVKATFLGEVGGRIAGRGGPGAVFYESGRLQSCKLSESLEIDGTTYKRARRITLDEQGHVIKVGI